jgi:hypothetical protein
MSLKTDLVGDVSIFFDTDDFGLAATYTVKGGTSGSSVTVVLDQVQDSETTKQSRGEAYYAHQGRLWCQVSEISRPQAGDTFVIGTDTWVVQDVIGGNAVAWELAVYRSAFAGKIR